MTEPVRETLAMIAGMSPRLQAGRWVFRSFAESPRDELLRQSVAMIREDEGISLVLPAADGETPAMAWITLDIHSALDGVGLTAAVSAALAGAGIACNMVAGFHHDHLLVPEADAERAVTALRARAAQARTTEPLA